MSKNKISIVIPNFDNMALDRNVIIDQAIQEISSGSITPTALRKREFFDSIDQAKLYSELVDVSTKLEKFISIQGSLEKTSNDLAWYSKNEFVAMARKLQSSIDEYNTYKTELEKSMAILSDNQSVLLYEDEYRNDGNNVVKRFGMHTAHLTTEQSLSSICTTVSTVNKAETKSRDSKSSKSERLDSLKKLHPVEVLLLRHAIQDLYKDNKSVLVDIFARDDNGAIKIEQEKPEVHTVVLYRQLVDGKQQILVIDPSNSNFSKHLANNAVRLDNLDIIVPNQSFQIYVVPVNGKVGSATDQYRDCTDIGVKIAFALNTTHIEIDINNIKKLNVIQAITNQQTKDNALFFSNTDAIAKIRQASSDDVRTQTHKLLICFDQLQKFTDTCSIHNTADMLKKYTEFFAQNTHEEYVDHIKALDDQYVRELHHFIYDMEG